MKTNIQEIDQLAQINLLTPEEDGMNHSHLPIEFIDGRRENVPAYLELSIEQLEAEYENLWSIIADSSDLAMWNELAYRGTAIIGNVTVNIRLEHDDFPLVTMTNKVNPVTRHRVEVIPTARQLSDMMNIIATVERNSAI